MNDRRLEADINDAASQAISLIEELEEEIETLKQQISNLEDESEGRMEEINELRDKIAEFEIAYENTDIVAMKKENEEYEIC